MMVVQDRFYTADDLWTLSHSDMESDMRYELDDGELIEMTPAGDTHGILAAWLLYLIMSYVVPRDLGEVTAAETGFVLYTNPQTGRDTVRAPDVGFIAKARLTPRTDKYFRLAPDFVIEVVSPNDAANQIRRKVRQYLRAGTKLIWVVYPDEDDRSVDVFRPDQTLETFKVGDTLDGGDVLPGFSLSVSEMFSRLRD